MKHKIELTDDQMEIVLSALQRQSEYYDQLGWEGPADRNRETRNEIKDQYIDSIMLAAK